MEFKQLYFKFGRKYHCKFKFSAIVNETLPPEELDAIFVWDAFIMVACTNKCKYAIVF